MNHSLSSIRSDLAAVREVMAERARRGQTRLTILCLPENRRGPDGEEGLLPRVQWRNHAAVCIIYDVESGAPSSAEIARLVDQAVPS